MKLTKSDIELFRDCIWNFYILNQRAFAWRHVDDPYKVVVSEIMLQQTQTYRVTTKYDQWLCAFPDFSTLARAPLRDVLSMWQGLGYSRRAIALQKIAQNVMNEYQGVLPSDPLVLDTFPGIGPATASSICAFAFNMPTVFIETNIRAVFIHSFFNDKEKVHDKAIYPLVEQTLDTSSPRQWYYALMDYGVMLKQRHKNPSRKSAHHTKQSKFEGSDRQIRGMVLRLLTEKGLMAITEIIATSNKEPERLRTIINQLCQEGFIKNENGFCTIV